MTLAHGLRGRALLVALAALMVCASLGVLVTHGATPDIDLLVQRWAVAHQVTATLQVSRALSILGGMNGMRVLGVLVAGVLLVRGERRDAAVLLPLPIVAEWACDAAKRLAGRPRPPGIAAVAETTWAYPSAHAMVSAATCAAIGWFAWRHGLVGRRGAIALATTIPVLVGASRVALNVHWLTDVLGGWSGGVALAACAVAVRGDAS